MAGEKILKKVKLSYRFQDKTSIEIDAYTTAVAGLVVCSRHTLRKDMRTGQIIGTVKRKNDWRISQYPIGINVLSGMRTKADAIEYAEKELAEFSWVGLLKKDLKSVNDQSKLRTKLAKLRKRIREAIVTGAKELK